MMSHFCSWYYWDPCALRLRPTANENGFKSFSSAKKENHKVSSNWRRLKSNLLAGLFFSLFSEMFDIMLDDTAQTRIWSFINRRDNCRRWYDIWYDTTAIFSSRYNIIAILWYYVIFTIAIYCIYVHVQFIFLFLPFTSFHTQLPD